MEGESSLNCGSNTHVENCRRLCSHRLVRCNAHANIIVCTYPKDSLTSPSTRRARFNKGAFATYAFTKRWPRMLQQCCFSQGAFVRNLSIHKPSDSSAALILPLADQAAQQAGHGMRGPSNFWRLGCCAIFCVHSSCAAFSSAGVFMSEWRARVRV